MIRAKDYRQAFKPIRQQLRKYQKHIFKLDNQKQTIFLDSESLGDFFKISGWKESYFSQLISYINTGLYTLQEDQFKAIIDSSKVLAQYRNAQIDSLQSIAKLQSVEIKKQLAKITGQHRLINTLEASIKTKNQDSKALNFNIGNQELTLKSVQDNLSQKINDQLELEQQLATLSKESFAKAKENQLLSINTKILNKTNDSLKTVGAKRAKVNATLLSKQKKLEAEKIQTETWLKVLSAISIFGIILLTLVTNRMNTEKLKVTKAYEELEKTKNLLQLRTAELNLSHRELNHRIKNNLQQISSLIFLQEEEIEDEQAKVAFEALQGRIDTIKIVHQKLYAKQQQLTMVNMAEYVKDLVKYIVGHDASIHLAIPNDIIIEMDHATDIGLILNELVTNASKYAFPFTKKPEIWVQIKTEAHQLHLSVKDNGPGFPSNFSLDHITSFGLKAIVEMFVHKSGKGTLKTFNQNGAVVEITMPFDPKNGKLIA